MSGWTLKVWVGSKISLHSKSANTSSLALAYLLFYPKMVTGAFFLSSHRMGHVCKSRCSCVGCCWKFLSMTQMTDYIWESLWGVQSGASILRVIKLAKTQRGALHLLQNVVSQPLCLGGKFINNYLHDSGVSQCAR